MDSIGGIKAIFPLLAQYDLPTGDDLDANLHWFESPQKNKLFFRVNPQLNTNFLRLMDILLRGNEANRKFIEASDGISLLRYLLQRVSMEYMTVDALRAVLDMAQSMVDAHDLFPRIVSLLLFNLELWCGASFDTVLSLLQGILSIDGVTRELSENEWITADLIDDPISSACYSALSVRMCLIP